MTLTITGNDPFMTALILQNVTERDGCWEWDGGRRKGYGRIWVDGKPYSVHRVIYADMNGPIPEGMVVLHDCDNPACCRPEHLKLGTQADNMADMMAKGRHKAGAGGSTTTHAFGADHVNAKMSDATVTAIRTEYEAGGVTQKTLATKHGVHQSQVSRVLRGKGWTHVP